MKEERVRKRPITIKCYDMPQKFTAVALGRVQNLIVLKEAVTNVNNADCIIKHANWCVKL